MQQPSFRKWLYFTLLALRGQPLGAYYERFVREDQKGISPDTTKELLIRLLDHCQRSVPYYAEVMHRAGNTYHKDPEEYLQRLPVLTKEIIRTHFDDLKSVDLPQRKWYFNTSSGSTGEPVRFIQDWDHAARTGAISLLFSRLVGHEVGECVARLWGSERDIIEGSVGWRAQLLNWITNTVFLNAYRMTPDRMRHFIEVINRRQPKLIVAYADAMFELARFVERERLEITPPGAIITSAETLHPFMREKIEQIFRCQIFNRYGSREVGDIACERPGIEGFWVAPWGNYIEITNSRGDREPPGVEGEILVTSLTNYAMPLIRYQIGDWGALSPTSWDNCTARGQVLRSLLGRTSDIFRNSQGMVVESGYFEGLLYFKEWVRKFQIIQKSCSCLLFRIVRNEGVPPPSQAELDGIVAKTKLLMGQECEVIFEFTDDIPANSLGKYRYMMSDVTLELWAEKTEQS